MTREQTEAHVLNTVRRVKLCTGPYFIPEDLLLEIVQFAWAAGQNYGFKRGGEFAIEKFDTGIARADA